MKDAVKNNIRQSMKWLAVLGVLLPVTWIGSASTRSVMADLERLQWLCSDYQLPVAGYVVEGWFQTVHVWWENEHCEIAVRSEESPLKR